MVIDLIQDCDRFVLSEEQIITDFDCGNEDLNEFFNHDALLYRRHRLMVDENDHEKVFITTFGSSVWHGYPVTETQ